MIRVEFLLHNRDLEGWHPVMTTHARNEGPGGCVPWEKYAALSKESVRLAKALHALREDMQVTPGLHEAGDAWVATRERVDWLSETAAVMADDAGTEPVPASAAEDDDFDWPAHKRGEDEA